MRRMTYPGTLSPEETQRERDHRKISRKAAAEGIVLLENDGVLPIAPGSKVALYGGGARYTIKGGTGSGSVNNRSNVSIDEGLRAAGLHITTDAWLDDYDARYADARQAWIEEIYRLAGEPGDFTALYRAHASHPMPMPKGSDITSTDTDTVIYVVSRVSGEGADRKAVKGDYYLSELEEEELEKICSLYKKTILILNLGGIIDLSFMDRLHLSGLVLLSQAGMEGGNALADVLTGKVCPSGKLTDTWAYHYEDYPGSANFSHNNGNVIEEKYEEGIYVGYRWFDSFGQKVRYPFGFGRSYTSFEVRFQEVGLSAGKASVKVKVKNTGSCSGKEAIQAYVSCPAGKLPKENKRLAAFAKTGLLEPGQEQDLELCIDLRILESYHTAQAAWYLEAGMYYLLVGTSSQEVSTVAALHLSDTVRMEQVNNICPLLDALREKKVSKEQSAEWAKKYAQELKDNGGQILELSDYLIPRKEVLEAAQEDCDAAQKAASNLSESPSMKKAASILPELTIKQKAALVCGRMKEGEAEFIGNAGVTVPGAAGESTALLEEDFGLHPFVMADGPAGLRLQACYEENPEDGSIYTMDAYQALQNRLFAVQFPHDGSIRHYQYCSAIPVGTLLAQSFDVDLLREVGAMIGREMQEFGVKLWLAPGMNIHRNPLCGRNFEYYSEDPLVSGLMAAAITQGVQSIPGCGTTIKHFACNNQEENRRGVSSIVSERALREIYLRGFEIAVRTGQPMAIMTSYNKINGVHTANSYDLCTQAARNEWGFSGIIMTDWTTTNSEGGSSAAKCIAAGNDLVMPGRISDILEIIDAVNKEADLALDEAALDTCAQRVLALMCE